MIKITSAAEAELKGLGVGSGKDIRIASITTSNGERYVVTTATNVQDNDEVIYCSNDMCAFIDHQTAKDLDDIQIDFIDEKFEVSAQPRLPHIIP
jgi:Fe-S cluster assembly iron-binding protein IscA